MWPDRQFSASLKARYLFSINQLPPAFIVDYSLKTSLERPLPEGAVPDDSARLRYASGGSVLLTDKGALMSVRETGSDFAARLAEIYGPDVQAMFNMPGPSDDASFKLPVRFDSSPPEPLLPGDEQLRRMTSYAQRLQANLRFSEPVVLSQTVGQDRIPLPWKRYSFTFITDIPPERLFDASRFKGNGLRLSTVTAELHGSRYTYTLEGVLYADN